MSSHILALDSRVKIFWFLCVSISIFLSDNIFILLSILFVATVGLFGYRERGAIYEIGRTYLAIYFLIILLISFLLQDQYTFNGFINATILSLRLITLALIAIVYFQYTRETEFIEALHVLWVPNLIALAVGVAIRFIPVIFEETQRILMAQRARGLATGRGLRVIKRIPTIIRALAMPLFVASWKRANDLVIILHLRRISPSRRQIQRSFNVTLGNILVIIYTLSILIMSFIDKIQ